MSYWLVFLGGGLGSVARYGVGLLLAPYTGRFPWATLVANGMACVVLGLFIGANLRQPVPSNARLLLATGFCGGFSTFSTFTSETWHLFQNGNTLTAGLNIFVSLAVCFLCLILGIKISTGIS